MVTSLAYPSLLYTAVLSVSYWAWIAIEIWLIVRERRNPTSDYQDRGSRTILIACWIIAITLGLFIVPHAVPQFTIRTKMVAMGVALIWSGIAYRLWAIRKLGSFFNTRVVIQEGQSLITSGPYRYIRNPSYTGSLMTFLGFGVAIGNWMSLVTLLVFGAIPYVRRIGIEERALAASFGQPYAEYQRKTWSLIPIIW